MNETERPSASRRGTAPADGLQAAAQRARAVRRAIGKLALGTLFLVGALAHGLGPEPHARQTTFWMAALALLSTVNVGLGLRTLAEAHRKPGRLWAYAAAAWGLLAVVLLRLLLALR